jgi:hypothetical protein
VVADALGNIVILQRRRIAGQRFGDVCGHVRFLCKFADDMRGIVIGVPPRCQFVARCLSMLVVPAKREAREPGPHEHRPVFMGPRFRGDDLTSRATALATMPALFRPNVAA